MTPAALVAVLGPLDGQLVLWAYLHIYTPLRSEKLRGCDNGILAAYSRVAGLDRQFGQIHSL